jgi:hypothetical protein
MENDISAIYAIRRKRFVLPFPCHSPQETLKRYVNDAAAKPTLGIHRAQRRWRRSGGSSTAGCARSLWTRDLRPSDREGNERDPFKSALTVSSRREAKTEKQNRDKTAGFSHPLKGKREMHVRSPCGRIGCLKTNKRAPSEEASQSENTPPHTQPIQRGTCAQH